MMEFNNNNNIILTISFFLSFLNKGFYFRIFFDRNFIFYEIIRKRLQIIKIENILIKIKKFLEYKKSRLKINREIMKN